MKFGIFLKNGALGSDKIFHNFMSGLEKWKIPYVINDNRCDVAVIWSVLWQGRMRDNQAIYQQFRNRQKSVVVIETGQIFRGKTFKLSVNGTGYDNFSQKIDTNLDRCTKLGLKYLPWNFAGDKIYICSQNAASLQWNGMPKMEDWINTTISQVRFYSDRQIIIRPHPRNPINVANLKLDKGIRVELSQKLPGTIDSVNFEQAINGAKAVINHNSAPAVNAVLAGIPTFCDWSSPARPVSHRNYADIENPTNFDREAWLKWLSYTEWLPEEMAGGQAIKHLLDSGLILDK